MKLGDIFEIPIDTKFYGGEAIEGCAVGSRIIMKDATLGAEYEILAVTKTTVTLKNIFWQKYD